MMPPSDNRPLSSRHVPVLLDEVCEMLRAPIGGRFLDCTFGGGGHSRALLDAHEATTVVGCDRDLRALARAESLVTSYGGRLVTHHADFCALSSLLSGEKFDGILADLGMSTDQLFEGRGFSFADASPLDMRMDESQGFSASDVVNLRSEQDLVQIFRDGGLGRDARTVARAIIKARPIESTKQLVDIVAPVMLRAKPEKGAHPATVVFQAIRVAVNDEMRNIEALLDTIPQLVKPGARVAIISFHSGEDTVVTRRLREWASRDGVPAWYPGDRRAREPIGRLLTKKAVVPSAREVDKNPAARSARLRVFEFDGQ